MENSAANVVARCNSLKRYWNARNAKFREWYRLIEQIDELKSEGMESFVGNDPRSMFNLVLHMLDAKIPHRLETYDTGNLEIAGLSEAIGNFLDRAWAANQTRFRKTGPRQSLSRTILGLLLATGWYSVFSIVSDDGKTTFVEPWNPAEVYPMWDFFDLGLDEVGHIFSVTANAAKRMADRNGWSFDVSKTGGRDVIVYDYWWVDHSSGYTVIWNAVCIGEDNLVKFEPTRFKHIPVYVSPVGGLPDIGALNQDAYSEGAWQKVTAQLSSTNAESRSERWKTEVGQSIVATNEHIYRTWNKMWTYSLQLLRDTAQPRIFERSQSGKSIVKPEQVFRRGAIFRGGPNDSVEFIGTPPIPLEMRSTQLDLEAMMQRGGVSWALHGNLEGQVTAYVMSQISASANQVMKPFHQAFINLIEDIDNDWIEDIRERGSRPYGFAVPTGFTDDMRVVANYEIEIPGELVQKATVARMLDPNFRVSYTYVMNRLFPDIKNPLQEKARVNADEAERSPENATIAYIMYCRKQAAMLRKNNQHSDAELYDLAEQAALVRLNPQQQAVGTNVRGGQRTIGNRAEGLPTTEVAPREVM